MAAQSEDAQNVQIQIHPAHALNLIRAFALIDTFYGLQWFC